MTKTQFLILIIALIPLLNCAIIKLFSKSPNLVNLLNRAAPIFFLANLIGLYASLKTDNSFLNISDTVNDISFGFAVDRTALGFLFLLSFFWLILVFYSQRFLQINPLQNVENLKFFFTLIIAFLNLIIISKNLLSTLFFYNCLILSCHFFAIKFLHKSETKFSRFFTFLLYIESIFFFLAIVATYKFSGQINFEKGGIISQNSGFAKDGLLLAFYLIGLFCSVLLPCYLLYRNINLDPIILYIFFFLSYAFGSLYIFVKLINFIFGLKEFGDLIDHIGFNFFEIVFLLNFIAVSVFLIFSKGIKSSFFYLFFHQFIFTLFAIFLFGTFSSTSIYIAILAFFLSFTLIFISTSNLVLYLTKAQDKKLDGLFYTLPITTILLIFGLLDTIGLSPTIGTVEKFLIIKTIFREKLWLSAVILAVNFVSLALFIWKMFFPFFRRLNEAKNPEDIELARNIDFDSSLMLTGLVLAVIMFLGLILSPFITNFFSHL